MLNLQEHPHRRYDPLRREWVLVSPHRFERPWQGETERVSSETRSAYDPACYLCPGNARAGGVLNPAYEGTFVFDNDFAALLPDTPVGALEESGLIVAYSEPGICRVVCFSPRHDLTLSRLPVAEIRRVVDTWTAQYQELGSLPFINSVQIFENRGAMMGASNPHPHGQVWANASLPNEMARELAALDEYQIRHRACLLCDYLALEQKAKERLVCWNDHFVVLVPFWAVWPFETLVLSLRHVTGLDELSTSERDSLADVLKRVTTHYDNLFRTAFPYTMGFHQRPTDNQPHLECHLHAHFYPPLLRSATVRKFMVGYELLGMPQRDITAETAAARLRSLSAKHYLE